MKSSSFTNLRESFLETVSDEPRIVPCGSSGDVTQVIFMSPIVHERLTKIENRLNHIEQSVEYLEHIKMEPFLQESLRTPKSRTEWLFSWNEGLKEIMNAKKVFSFTIPCKKVSSYNDNFIRNTKSIIELFYRSSIKFADEYSRPTKLVKMPISIKDMRDYFPLQSFDVFSSAIH